MKKLILLFSLMALTACQNGGTGSSNGAPTPTGKNQNSTPSPDPDPKPAEKPYPDFTPYGISEMRHEIYELGWRTVGQTLTQSEREILAGAYMDQAAKKLKEDIDWEKVTEKDLKGMKELFFTNELKPKMNKE